MELGARESEFLGKQFKALGDLGYKKYLEGRDLDVEAIKFMSTEYLRNNHKNNEGNNGVIFKLELKENDEELEYAGKILKVGSFEDLHAEYENQIAAYEILAEEIKNGADPELYARVPMPCFCFPLDVDENLKEHLQEEGISKTENSPGLLLMDWIKGEDVATHIFKEALQLAESSYTGTIKEGNFNQLHQAVSLEFEFAKPGGKATREGDRIYEQRKVEAENESKVLKFLKKKGYKFPQSTLDQIRNTIDLFKSKGLEMWDSHARNVMLSNDGGRPYLIDFAPQKKQLGGDARNLDAYVLIRQLEDLTSSPQEDFQSEQEAKLVEWDADFKKMLQNSRWKDRYIDQVPKGVKFLKMAKTEIGGGVDADKVQGYIYSLIHQVNEGEIDRSTAVDFLAQLSSKEILPWRKAKIDMAIKKTSI